MAVFLGVQLGIILFFMVGPVFVLIMEETIKSGKMSAFRLAAGMWSGDLIYAVIMILSISTLLPSLEEIDIRWGYVLALGLIGIGIQSIHRREENIFNQKISAPKTKGLFWKGFLINIFNPFVIAFWAAIATQIKDKSNHFVLLFIRVYLQQSLWVTFLKYFQPILL
ncbi:MAG: LysE family transporter [Chitinophagales bacterium]|nr:LysE family transporter [Chitinophagales bacterium]